MCRWRHRELVWPEWGRVNTLTGLQRGMGVNYVRCFFRVAIFIQLGGAEKWGVGEVLKP